MDKNRLASITKVILAVAATLILAIFTIALLVYLVKSTDMISIRVHSTASMFGFIGILLIMTGVLSVFGTLLETLRIHLFKEHFRYATVTIQELVLIILFGLCLHVVDLWIDGVEIMNAQSEVILTLVIYAFFYLIVKFSDKLKAQDAAAKKEHRS
ncbi:hypothetical protein PAECIP111893_03508 [Paenibacillus plantiphilus]|uniref:Regulatory protein YrvL n=1 Tax=Paenibacillus plantiphilus TaxID=2905650 RepID=A0ABM9CH48_9BACL|nr:hypothetical protein [Paenibacillus plantiphilus]CAH1212245.1 hypothetical protein PAECIP111893_03508 [Paenibacillus plantiphilus]